MGHRLWIRLLPDILLLGPQTIEARKIGQWRAPVLALYTINPTAESPSCPQYGYGSSPSVIVMGGIRPCLGSKYESRER